jgi:uncharacterized membrane protein YqjE
MQGTKHSDAHRHREQLQRGSAPVSRGQHRPDFSDSVDSVGAAQPLGGSVRGIAATLVEIVRTRIELAGTELAEERLCVAQQALAAAVALFCLGAGLVLAVLTVAWWAGPENAAAVLGVAAMLLLAAAAGAMVWSRRIVAQRPVLLQETLRQLRADARALAPDRAT